MQPQKPLTISDTLALLTEKTSLQWTEVDLLQAAKNCYPPLQAYPDEISPVVTKLYANGTPLVEVSHSVAPWDAAILAEGQIQQLLDNGKTYAEFAVGHEDLIHTKLPVDQNPHGYPEGEYWQTKQFTPPVLVTAGMVRVPVDVIEKLLSGKIAWPITLKQTVTAAKVKTAPPKKIEMSNLVYWRTVLYTKIQQFDTAAPKGKATVRKVIKNLKELKDQRIPDKGGVDELVWLDDIGNEHTVTKKTISTAISKARKLPI